MYGSYCTAVAVCSAGMHRVRDAPRGLGEAPMLYGRLPARGITRATVGCFLACGRCVGSVEMPACIVWCAAPPDTGPTRHGLVPRAVLPVPHWLAPPSDPYLHSDLHVRLYT